MRPRRRSVRVMLRQEVVWELLDQLNISQNELARRCASTPAAGHGGQEVTSRDE